MKQQLYKHTIFCFISLPIAQTCTELSMCESNLLMNNLFLWILRIMLIVFWISGTCQGKKQYVSCSGKLYPCMYTKGSNWKIGKRKYVKKQCTRDDLKVKCVIFSSNCLVTTRVKFKFPSKVCRFLWCLHILLT